MSQAGYSQSPVICAKGTLTSCDLVAQPNPFLLPLPFLPSTVSPRQTLKLGLRVCLERQLTRSEDFDLYSGGTGPGRGALPKGSANRGENEGEDTEVTKDPGGERVPSYLNTSQAEVTSEMEKEAQQLGKRGLSAPR